MTQAELAGGEFTTAFISQLETGYSGLSLHAAQVLSSRLGVTIADLAGDGPLASRHDEARLLEAEQELAVGDAPRASTLASELKASAALRARILRLRGQALFAMDRPRDALPLLHDAVADFRARGQADMAARTLFDIALAHARLDESEEVILNALECERALRSGELVDRTVELRVRSTLAAAYVRRGDFAAADLQAERAIALAKDVVDREALASLYATLARTEQDRGRFDPALRYWERSLAELEALGREHAVAETWNNLANLRLARGQVRDAQEALSRADELARALGHRRLRPWLDVTRARLALVRRRFSDAQQLAAALAGDRGNPGRVRAEAQLITAQALAGSGAPFPRVRTAFEAALDLAQREPAGGRARILRHFADALEASGDARGAAKVLREALDLVRPDHTARTV